MKTTLLDLHIQSFFSDSQLKQFFPSFVHCNIVLSFLSFSIPGSRQRQSCGLPRPGSEGEGFAVDAADVVGANRVGHGHAERKVHVHPGTQPSVRHLRRRILAARSSIRTSRVSFVC